MAVLVREAHHADSEHAERERLLRPLLDDIDALAARGLSAISALPAYAAQSEAFFADVLDQIRRNYTALLNALIDGRQLAAGELAYQRGASMRRARAGFALEDYLSAYRVGQQVLWDSIVEVAEQSGADQRMVLSLASQVMRQMDFAASHAGQAYVEFRQYGLADAAKERRDLLERLLDGSLPESGPLVSAAERYGLGSGASTLVAVALPLGSAADRDGSELASATLARAAFGEPSALVVVRHAEIVAILSLGRDGNPDQVCAGLERAQQRLSIEGMPLAIGVSTIADCASELPHAYREATAAVGFVGRDGGVCALTRMSPFEYLALNADGTARRMIHPRVQAFLDEDRARGGMLVETIRAYADANLSLKDAAAQLHVHPNTAQYRFHRVEERTGLNPRHFGDLHALLVAITLDDAAAQPAAAARSPLAPANNSLGKSLAGGTDAPQHARCDPV